MFAGNPRFAEGVWEKGELQKKAGVRTGEQEAQNLVPQVVLTPVERENVFSCLQQTDTGWQGNGWVGAFLSLASTRILAILAVLQPQLCHCCGNTQALGGVWASETLPECASLQGGEQIAQF